MNTAPVAPAKAPRSNRASFWIGVLVGVVVALGVVAAVLAFRNSSVATDVFLLRNRQATGVVETASGLQYKMLEPGKGARPTNSDIALLTYEGKLTDGTTFDASQTPTPMPVGSVVAGFSEALKLMPKGAKYRIWIKPSLGYGDKATGPIPANSVLVFDVHLLDFLPEATVRQMQQQQQQQQAQPQVR